VKAALHFSRWESFEFSHRFRFLSSHWRISRLHVLENGMTFVEGLAPFPLLNPPD
jgi:hypothetical protein